MGEGRGKDNEMGGNEVRWWYDRDNVKIGAKFPHTMIDL